MGEIVLRLGKYFVFFLAFLATGSSCNKEQDYVIPSIPFTYSINLTIHNELNIPGTSVFIPNIGYGGIIVYCETQGVFHAYDAACTHEVISTCRVETEGSIIGTCSCCESQFILLGGYPTSGPAAEPLRQYRTTMGNGFLRVYNNN